MHLTAEQIQRQLDGELAAAESRQVAEHLQVCAACRAELQTVQAEERAVFELLSKLDHPARAVALREVQRASRPHRLSKYAAGIVLTLGLGGLAYALPASPLRTWLASLFDADRERGAVQVQRNAPTADQAGIAVVPGADFTIAFATHQSSGAVLLTLTDDPQVVVRTTDARVRFASSTDRLLIANEGSVADFHVLIPRALRAFTMRAGAQVIFTRRGDRLPPIQPDSSGRYRIPLQ